MDLGTILDGTPEPSMTSDTVDFLNGKPPDTSGEYCLPVPMTDYQRLLYDQVVSAHYSDLLKFFETNEPVMVESLQTLYLNSQLVSTHPFLLVNHYLPPNLLLKEVPERLANSSGKFKVLHDIVELTKDLQMEVALVARPGKTIDLIEAFLLGKPCNFVRYSGSYLREHADIDPALSTFHLFPSTQLDTKHIQSSGFDFTVAFDLSYDEDADHVKFIRLQTSTRNKNNHLSMVPLVRLIPYYSVEHIVYQLQKKDPLGSKKEIEFLKRVLSAISVLRDKVGLIPTDLKPLYAHNLKYLSKWLQNPAKPWILPACPDIAEYTALDVEKSLLTEVGEDIAASSTNARDDSSAKDYYQVKRLKRETDIPILPDETFIMDGNSKVDSKSNIPVEGPSEILTHKIIQKLDFLMLDNEQKVTEIQTYTSHESARQRLLEETLEEVAGKIKQADELEKKLKAAESRIERLQTSNTLKDEKLAKTTKELADSRELFSKGTIEQSEFEKQRAQIAELETKLNKAEKSLESTKTQNDYLTQEYQKASQAAAEFSAQIKQLEADKQELEKKSAEEAAKLRLLSFDEERVLKNDIIKKQQLQISNLEEQLIRVLEKEKLAPTSRSRYGRGQSRTKSPAAADSS